jgi:hypothetical protein
VLVRRPKEERPLGIQRPRRENIIKIDHQEIGEGHEDRLRLGQDSDM